MNEIDVKKRDIRTMFLIKDLLEHTFPRETRGADKEDFTTYALAVAKFIAHAKEWNPGVEEIASNLVCRFKNENFDALPEYRGPITNDGVIHVIDVILGRSVKQQLLGSQSRKNLFALSEQILKHEELGALSKRISRKLFLEAANIEGADPSY